MVSRRDALGLAVSLSLPFACAPRPAAPGAREREQEVDALLRPYDSAVPGAALLVLHDGRPLVRRGYGLADVEARVPVVPATCFRLASVTKQLTATAILLLAQDGKLSPEDPLKRWLPSLHAATEPMTVRHLLTHTSGIVDYEEAVERRDPAQASVQVHDADVLAILAAEPRTYFRPGTAYRYSNSGYALLALIVERASGQSFASFLASRVFRPLGMRDTVAHEEGISTVARRAWGYTSIDGRWRRTDQSATSAVLGDGGVYSSIDDLARWDAALYDDRLLSGTSRRLAFAPHTPTDLPDVAYGFGWRITGETLWHSGETVGFRNVIVRWPTRRFTVVLLTNRNEPEPYATALAIAGLYLPFAPVRSG